MHEAGDFAIALHFSVEGFGNEAVCSDAKETKKQNTYYADCTYYMLPPIYHFWFVHSVGVV